MRLDFTNGRFAVLVAMLLVPGSGALGQISTALPHDRLEAQVDSIFAGLNSSTPGCAVAVMRHGELLLKKAYGMANIELAVPMTPATSTWIPYSEARVFVALAVGLLARDGVISLDDPIRRYVPEVPSYASDVRVRQLIHHTSGLADYGTLAGPGWLLHDRMSEDEFFRILARWGRLGFEPGAAMVYSNTDYALLKILVERVTGNSLHALLDERIFEPLGMGSTRVGADQSDVFPMHALFYEASEGGYRTLLRYRVSPVGQISVTTSVDDLVRWERGLRDGDLSLEAVLDELRLGAPSPDEGYAFGVYPTFRSGTELEVHRGIGEYTYLTRAPRPDVSVATVCNAYAGMWNFGPSIAALVAQPAPRDEPAAARSPAPALSLPPAELQRFAGEYHPPHGGEPTVRLTVADEAMHVTAPDGVIYDARPVGDGIFEVDLSPSVTLRLVFEGVDSLMTLRILNAGTGDPEAPLLQRWTPTPPSAAALRTYPGVYAGVDVDVTLYVDVSGSDVMMASRGLPATKLVQTPSDDAFALSAFSTNYDVVFERDAAGEVTHLRLDASRVRGIRFVKVRPR